MDAAFGSSIKRQVGRSGILPGIRIGPAYDLNLAKRILAQISKVPGAIARLLAGPPMSEWERYNQAVAEVRVRSLAGLTSAWFPPR